MNKLKPRFILALLNSTRKEETRKTNKTGRNLDIQKFKPKWKTKRRKS